MSNSLLRYRRLRMKNTYKDLVDYAYSLVNIINRNYLNGKTTAYPVLLFGIGNCLVEGKE